MRCLVPLLLLAACTSKGDSASSTGTIVGSTSSGTPVTGTTGGTPTGTTTTSTIPFDPGPATAFPHNGGDEDLDPDLMLAADGRMVLVWASRVLGNTDLYLSRTLDGVNWDPPIALTTDPDVDRFPNLYQDDNAHYHMTWMRQMETTPFYTRVWYAKSEDGVNWYSADERLVADIAGPVEDREPSIARAADGSLWVVFSSDVRSPSTQTLFAVQSTDGGLSWNPPVELPVNDPLQHDSYPHLDRVGADLALTWVRSDMSAIPAPNNPTSDVLWSTSADGTVWAPPTEITANDASSVYDLYPASGSDHAGNTQLVWQSTAATPGNAYVLPVAGVYPTDVVEAPLEGESPRMAPTPVTGVYLGVWVDSATQDLWTRSFSL